MQRTALLTAYIVGLFFYSTLHPEDFASHLQLKSWASIIIFVIIYKLGSFEEEKFNRINKDLDDTKKRLADFHYLEKKRAEAGLGNVESQMIVADILLENRINSSGEVRKQNITEAVKWHQKAARQGNARAQYYLGKHYAQGTGLKKNARLAYIWLLMAEGDISFYLDDTIKLIQ